MNPILEGENTRMAVCDWPPAVITGAYQTGVLGVRALRGRGVRALCIDCDPALPGFRSVYGPARLCPNPDLDPLGWTRFMCALADEMGRRPVLIHSADQFVTAAARHADMLNEHYILANTTNLQGRLADKPTQYELAALHGMPLPLTRSAAARAEVSEFARISEFPCLLKPVHFREWQRFPSNHPLTHRKVVIAETPDDLIKYWELAAEVNPNVIVQEIIKGPDSAKRVYLSVYDSNGHRTGALILKELRCDPVGFGPASVTEPVVDPEVDEICDRFLTGIGYTGICEIEVKRDLRDGKVKLIETNPRLSGSGDAAPYAGVDLCWLHYLDLIGRTAAPVTPSSLPFRHIVLRADAKAAVTYWRSGLATAREILRPYWGRRVFYDLDWRDWRYSLETMLVALKTLIAAFLKPLADRPRP